MIAANEDIVELVAAASDSLKGGEHDGECFTEGNRCCSHHLAKSAEREQRLERALQKFNKSLSR